jgi:cellulose synthase/poly-beta-1,6-N-acetylglucosamine synthase-like glycosyltransferase
MSAAGVIIFWVSLAAIAYTPLGYMICLAIISRVIHRPPQRAPIRPSVSIIVPVHNGASLVRQKIENLRELQYPPDLLQIIVVDDCSDDDTYSLIQDVTWIRLDRRQGKPAALNAGLAIASGEVIGFTDVGVVLEPNALKAAVERFVDRKVGCVSSEDVVVSEGGVGEGEGVYTRIDTAIRRLESTIGSLAGVSGSFYLVRRQLFPPFPLDLATDMFSGLYCVDRGYRAVVEESSKVRIYAQRDAGKEFERKVRTMVTGLRAIRAFARLLNPLRSGLFAWFLLSHKLMRYLMPVFAVAALFSCAYLGPSSKFFTCCFLGEMVTLSIGTTQILMQTSTLIRRLPGAPAFLCTSIAAAVVAWFRFAAGERYETWSPTERSAV